jgi:hypothetical protein
MRNAGWVLAGLMVACRGTPPTTSPTSTAAPSAAPSPSAAALAPGQIDLSGYARTCKTADDCVLVHAFPCDHCGCPKHAIAKSEHDRYREAASAVDCKQFPDKRVCGECMPYTATCEAGTCGSTQQR